MVEVGVRARDGSALVTVVNHHPEAQKVGVILVTGQSWFVNAVSMQEIGSVGVADGTRLDLEVPGRGARVIAAYPSKPAALSLMADTEQVAPGSDLAYTLTVTDAQGKPVPGAVLVETRVTDPEGGVVTRYGVPLAALGGVRQVRAPVAINAAPGAYVISARVPFTGLTASARFEVK
jgi:hypothetical protein